MDYNEYELNILRKLNKVTSQQKIADDIGCSIGKVNFILKALAKKGLIKTEKFINSKKRSQYKYLLTEQGIKEKIVLTERFIEKKKKEYEELQAEMQSYKEQYDYAKKYMTK